MIFQTWLARSAWLNKCISLKPRPPVFLEVTTFRHAIHDIFHLSFVEPHQKRAIILSISEQSSIGN